MKIFSSRKTGHGINSYLMILESQKNVNRERLEDDKMTSSFILFILMKWIQCLWWCDDGYIKQWTLQLKRHLRNSSHWLLISFFWHLSTICLQRGLFISSLWGQMVVITKRLKIQTNFFFKVGFWGALKFVNSWPKNLCSKILWFDAPTLLRY